MAQSILIVDDEKEIVSMLYCYFSKLGYTVYHKIEANDLDFTLSYPLNDEMGKLCHAFEKMKDCLSKNNETMFRQFAEQRRLNAAFSHDLRTPLTLLKGHATMLLSFIPKGLVSQEEILDEISVMSKNISRLEKYVNAMTNLYRLEDIDIPRQQITFHSLIDNFNNTAEALCYLDLKHLSFLIENTSDKEYRYSPNYFEIEAEQSGTWYQLEQLDDPSKSNEKDCFIKPNERLTLEIDVKSFYGELPAGHYRLIKQFAFFESERDWDYDTYNLSCEFTIR